jgi:hypothetical protein
MKIAKVFLSLAGALFFSLVMVLLLGMIGLAAGTRLFGYGHIYQTEDPSNYGSYVGNFDNKTPDTFIRSFFPESIEDSFSDVQYHYTAKKGDAYAYEAVLEFSVRDRALFHSLKDGWTAGISPADFPYDPSFEAFAISTDLLLNDPCKTLKPTDPAIYSIEYARIGMILVSEESQKFVFVAMGVYDGGGTNTEELSYFFTRFRIDPTKFSLSGTY